MVLAGKLVHPESLPRMQVDVWVNNHDINQTDRWLLELGALVLQWFEDLFGNGGSWIIGRCEGVLFVQRIVRTLNLESVAKDRHFILELLVSRQNRPLGILGSSQLIQPQSVEPL